MGNEPLPRFIRDLLMNPGITKLAVGFQSQDDEQLAARFPGLFPQYPKEKKRVTQDLETGTYSEETWTVPAVQPFPGLLEIQTELDARIAVMLEARGLQTKPQGRVYSFTEICLAAGIQPVKDGYKDGLRPGIDFRVRYGWYTAQLSENQIFYASEDAWLALLAYANLTQSERLIAAMSPFHLRSTTPIPLMHRLTPDGTRVDKKRGFNEMLGGFRRSPKIMKS